MLEHLKPFNIILACDGYKANHWEEIASDIRYTYANIVPRKASKYSDEIVVMGTTLLAYIISSVRITQDMIDEAELEITQQGYSFNRKGWEDICKYNHGILPIEILGVEEGRVVNPQTPIVGIRNTLEGYAWLVTYLETFAQSLIWKMSTVASICRTVRKTLEHYCDITGTDKSRVNYMLHNFGDRGADSPHEAAVIAGISHAAIFDGSDCIRANGYIKKLYNTSKVYTTSIEATEHSVMCSHSNAKEKDDFGAALMAVDRLYACVERYKKGIGLPYLSVVIDTYDDERFVREYLGELLKDRIINSGGKLICRPDTGNPITKPVEIANILKDKFGYTKNDKGFDVLNPCVAVIQGDGIKINTFESVVKNWVDSGFALDSLCLGMGSGVTHDGSRDDFSFSMKATANYRRDRWERELKEPKSDTSKKSLTGLVRCRENDNGELEVFDAIGLAIDPFGESDGWKSYCNDGFRKYRPSFDDIQNRARI